MIISISDLKLIRQEEPDAQIQEILNDPTILEKLSEAHSYPAPMPSKICFRIENEGTLIGQVCLKNIKWINHKAEISLFLRSDMRSQGHGLKALQAIIDFGFRRLNLFRLEAEVIDGNLAPLKLLEKTGFIQEGRLRQAKYVDGDYKDLLRYGLLREEYKNKY
jgi:RimJ/RimL family protein N-acetyltransferase